MQKWSRRSALGSILAVMAVAGTPLRALGITAPDQTMRLNRRLVRGLSDGEQIVVEREWLVDFASRGSGFAISGRQVSVRVDAPPKIAAIAAVERERSTDTMFPILLDANGLITAIGKTESAHDVAAAVAAAQDIIARSARSAPAHEQARFYLSQIQQAGSGFLDQFPRDLFFPRSPAMRETRLVNLPDGSQGEFEMIYSADADPFTGWMVHSERRIITRLAGSERHAWEHWSMRPA